MSCRCRMVQIAFMLIAAPAVSLASQDDSPAATAPLRVENHRDRAVHVPGPGDWERGAAATRPASTC